MDDPYTEILKKRKKLGRTEELTNEELKKHFSNLKRKSLAEMSDAEFEAIERKADAAETRRAAGDRSVSPSREDLKRKRALRSLVGKASDIQKLNKSDISKVSSFANKAAKNFKAPETKDLMKEVVKQTPVTKGLLSAVARGAGLIGAAATMNEFRKAHKLIKDNPTRKYGSKTLLDILMKD